MNYNTVKTYYITLKVDGQYQRMIKVEQGKDDSLYIKWNLSLAKNKDGEYNHRSYRSYHSEYNEEMGGYRTHMKGCGGNRIDESISYNKRFITEYSSGFFEFNFDIPHDTVIIDSLSSNDILFESDDYSKSQITFFSMKRKDLLEGKYDNASSKLLKFNNYDLIVVFLNNYKK